MWLNGSQDLKMMLNDREINQELSDAITPFEPQCVRDKSGIPIVSYGLQPASYDVRLSNDIFIQDAHFLPTVGPLLDFPGNWMQVPGSHFVLQPAHFVHALTLEGFEMPHAIVGKVSGKSTYARLGLFVLEGTIQPGWKGRLLLEMVNLGRLPIRLNAGQGIASVEFHRIANPEATYQGRYQGQYQDK
jgi:dCTP deaminase